MNLRIRELAALLLVVLIGPIVIHAQTLKPSYLSEMPAPARILAEIKGKDAEDTGERQMGAFMVLIKMMDDMAWGLEHRQVNMADTRKIKPDELRIRLGYQNAYADLWHKVKNKEGHVYDRDRDLLNEMLQKFFSESFRAKYFKQTYMGSRNTNSSRRRCTEAPMANSQTNPQARGRPPASEINLQPRALRPAALQERLPIRPSLRHGQQMSIQRCWA